MGGSSNKNDDSNYSSSSSSSPSSPLISDNEADIEMFKQAIQMNNYVLQCLQKNQNNDPIRVGSVPGHLVINRDCESADNNLFLDYFLDNIRFNDC